MNNYPPLFDTAYFNSRAFQSTNYLTREQADALYLSTNYLTYLQYNIGVIPGIVTPSKVLIVDSNKDISEINTLGCVTLNISSNLTMNNVNSVFEMSGNNSDILLSGSNSTITFTGASSDLLFNGNASNITFNGINSHVHLNGANNHIEILNTAASTNSNSGTVISAGGCYFGNDSIFDATLNASLLRVGDSTESNTNYLVSALDSTMSALTTRYITLGHDNGTGNSMRMGYTYLSNNSTGNLISFGYEGRFLLYLKNKDNDCCGLKTNNPEKQFHINDSAGNCLRISYGAENVPATYYCDFLVSSAGQLNITASSNNVNISGHDGSTKGLKLNNTLVTATATELNILDGCTATYNELNILDGATLTTTQLNYLSGVTPGTGAIDKALVLDSSRNITNINALTMGSDLKITAGDFVIDDGKQIILSSNVGAKTVNCSIYSNNASSMVLSSVGTDGYVKIKSNNSNVAVNSGICFNVDNNGTNFITCDGVNNRIGIFNSSPTYTFDVTGNISCSNTILVTSTADGNFLNCLDTSMVSTDIRYLSWGRTITNGDRARLSYYYNSSGSGENLMGFEFGNINSNRMYLTYGGKLVFNSANSFVTGASNIGTIDMGSNATDDSLNLYSTSSTRYGFGANASQLKIMAGNNGAVSFFSNATRSSNGNEICRMTYSTGDGFGRLGIGTSSPVSPLDVRNSKSITVNSGTYSLITNGADTYSNLTPVTFNVCAQFSSNIYCLGSIYTFSDRRLKKDIEILEPDYCDKFFNNVNLYSYKYKTDKETDIRKIGVIAQDLLKDGYIELLQMSVDNDLKKEEKYDIDGIKLTVDYSKISILCVQEIKNLRYKNYQLENEVKSLKDAIKILNNKIKNITLL